MLHVWEQRMDLEEHIRVILRRRSSEGMEPMNNVARNSTYSQKMPIQESNEDLGACSWIRAIYIMLGVFTSMPLSARIIHAPANAEISVVALP